MESARRLLQISAANWLQAFVALLVAAFVLHLVAHIVGGLFLFVALFAILFAAAAFIKSLFSGNQTPENTSGEEAKK